MAKFVGKIGFADTVEESPDVWVEKIIERTYRGDVIRNSRSLQSTSEINDGINISNRLSFVGDPYAINSIYKMRYVVFRGNKWKITNVDVESPRLILTIGGLYNE